MTTLTWRTLGAALLDLLLPGSCGGCGEPGPGWCAACDARITPSAPFLPDGPAVLAVGRYRGPLRTALLAYKERGRRDLASCLARLLARLVPPPPPGRQGTAPRPRADGGAPWQRTTRGAPGERQDDGGPPAGWWLVPAPSRPSAARARGGDHVLRLCRHLARADPRLRVAPALSLRRGARDSVGLGASERAANLAGRLRVRAALLPPPGAAVLLVDDVVTTGATLRACRDALAREGRPVAAAIVLTDATHRRARELPERSSRKLLTVALTPNRVTPSADLLPDCDQRYRRPRSVGSVRGPPRWATHGSARRSRCARVPPMPAVR
jgi:predicted amidophosphoribosyltransferase